MESFEVINFESSDEESLLGEIPDNKDKNVDSPSKMKEAEKESEVVMQIKTKKTKKKQKLLESQLPPDTKEARAHEEKIRSIKIHKDALDMHGFDMQILESYPHRVRDGDVPTFLLKDQKKKFEGFAELHEKISEEFKDKSLFPTDDHIQLIYEVFCKRFDCYPLPLLKYFHEGALSYHNYQLSLDHVKALACIIPLIPNLTHLHLKNNGLTDEMCTLLIIAAYQNPCINALSIESNSVKWSASLTIKTLMTICPEKILSLSLQGSLSIGNHLDRITRQFIVDAKGSSSLDAACPGQILSTLDLSNIVLSMTCCKNIGQTLSTTQGLKSLDL